MMKPMNLMNPILSTRPARSAPRRPWLRACSVAAGALLLATSARAELLGEVSTVFKLRPLASGKSPSNKIDVAGFEIAEREEALVVGAVEPLRGNPTQALASGDVDGVGAGDGRVGNLSRIGGLAVHGAAP